jgi:hypothetical protein
MKVQVNELNIHNSRNKMNNFPNSEIELHIINAYITLRFNLVVVL